MGTRDDRRQAARAWLREEAPEACRVKLCGMFRDEDVSAVLAAAPDLCGFIVDFPKSHRSVSPDRLAELCDALEAAQRDVGSALLPWRVGVFVDEPIDRLVDIVERCGIDVVQLHGSEDAAYVAELRARCGIGIVQAFRLAGPDDVRRACESAADLVLLDSGQGSGKAFDWSFAREVDRPFLLAGGLGPDNVARAVAEVGPWGVDMSSGIETDKRKDAAKMKAAVDAVRRA